MEFARKWPAASRLGRSASRWAVTGLYRGDGSIEGRDEYNLPTEAFEARSVAFGLQLAQAFGQQFALGAGAQYVGEHMGSYHGNGLAFDAGAQARFGPLALGLAAQHFGGGMLWAGQRWRMPATFGAGAAWQLPAGLRLGADWNAPSNWYRNVRLGAEWRWKDRVALRGGWRHDLGAPQEARLDAPAFGASFASGAMDLDYAYVVDDAGAGSQRFAVTVTPGRLPKLDLAHATTPHAAMPAVRPRSTSVNHHTE